jgi:pimeloyl-ACP methyl ester carboxylesterase
MDITLGRFHAQHERPEPLKFAWPIIVLPELFTTTRHLAVLIGYLATIGWEVYAPDVRDVAAQDGPRALGRPKFSAALALIEEVIAAVGRDAIIVGHGAGGLLALKMAERPHVRAAVALAPLVPGFRTPLFIRDRNLVALWRRRAINPPRGRTLFELIADAEPFQRENMIKALVPDSAELALNVARGDVELASHPQVAPRLIVAGDSDAFAPVGRVATLANAIGVQMVTLPGRGHWIIGGRALERTVAELQRFLVRALGQDLLLLYPDEMKE